MIDKYLDLDRELKEKKTKTVEHGRDDDPNCNWCSWNGPQGTENKSDGIGYQSKNQLYPDHQAVKISKNT